MMFMVAAISFWEGKQWLMYLLIDSIGGGWGWLPCNTSIDLLLWLTIGGQVRLVRLQTENFRWFLLQQKEKRQTSICTMSKTVNGLRKIAWASVFIYRLMSLFIQFSTISFLHVSISPCFHFSMFPFLHVSISPCFHFSTFPFLHVSISSCFHFSMFPCLHVYVSMSSCLCLHVFVSMSPCPCLHVSWISQTENGTNEKRKFVFLRPQTTNSNRRLLFQQTCPAVLIGNLFASKIYLCLQPPFSSTSSHNRNLQYIQHNNSALQRTRSWDGVLTSPSPLPGRLVDHWVDHGVVLYHEPHPHTHTYSWLYIVQ